MAQMGDAAAHWVDSLLRCPLCDKAQHESLVPHRGLPIPGQWQQRGPPAQSGGWGEPPDERFCPLRASSACVARCRDEPIGRTIAPVARENVPSVLGPAHLPATCRSSGTSLQG